MDRAGRAWRGWFPVGGELTSGVADHKEGLYLGTELSPDDPRVRAGRPLHGPNLWPRHPRDLRPAVEAWMASMAAVAEAVLSGLALALGLDEDWFPRHLTAEPTVLFRIFHYPPVAQGEPGSGRRRAHRLRTADPAGPGPPRGPRGPHPAGLGRRPTRPRRAGVNIGDMLDRMTGGGTDPRRTGCVRRGARVGCRCPYFYDPGWDAAVAPLPLEGDAPDDDADARWDGTSLRHLEGTYGEYLTAKVAQVFPALADEAGSSCGPG